jgi:hypothetical protein
MASKIKTTHGHTVKTKSKEYIAWSAMKARCRIASGRNHKAYKGRGVTVCERWVGSFVAFLSDVGPAPSEEHSLDRHPDCAGNYEPGNVRWATRIEQAVNRRTTRWITHDNKTLTISGWAELLGCRLQTITARIENGWSEVDAVSVPVRKFKNRSPRIT